MRRECSQPDPACTTCFPRSLDYEPRKRYKGMGGVLVGRDGRIWCSGGSRSHPRGAPKVRYETIDDAWRGAFLDFIKHGAISTPYHCNAHAVRSTVLKSRPHPNPWSWLPWMTKVITYDRKRRVTCGGWHITQRLKALPA